MIRELQLLVKEPLLVITSSSSEVLLGKRLLKICTKCTEEYPRRSVISINLQNNFIKITLQHGYSPVILLHIFTISISMNTTGVLLLLSVIII